MDSHERLSVVATLSKRLCRDGANVLMNLYTLDKSKPVSLYTTITKLASVHRKYINDAIEDGGRSTVTGIIILLVNIRFLFTHNRTNLDILLIW